MLKIGSHLPKLLSNIKGLFLKHGVYSFQHWQTANTLWIMCPMHNLFWPYDC